MSLIRQVALLLVATLVVALLAGVGVTVDAAREALQAELRLKNSDEATALGQVLSQQHGDPASMQLVAAAQFDAGHYHAIRLVGADRRPWFERQATAVPLHAPAWFVRLLPIDAPAGVAQLSDGWRALGSVEVVTQTAFAHDELWRGARRSTVALVLVGLVAGGLAAVGVGRIRRPLDRAAEQADALQRGEYRLLPEPAVPELRRLTRAMNALVERLRGVFEGHAAQVEALRRQATRDPSTGVANRAHFIARLGAATAGEDAPARGGLVLLRLARLGALNEVLGRARVDQVLGRIAEALLAYEDRAGGAFCGRLNGADFALALPEGGIALDTAQAILGLLRASLTEAGGAVSIAAGVVETSGAVPPAAVLAAADLALARAESGAPFTVASAEPVEAEGGLARAAGETAWRSQLRAALDAGAAELGAFRVDDRAGALLHLESPLRLVLDPGGAPVVAAHWLPLASRSRLTAEIDELALALALDAIARDGRPRAVNLAPASLRQGGFAARIVRRLREAPGAAAKVWLEVHEIAAAERLDLVAEFGAQVRPLGARLGLEHAGERLPRIERLFEAGLDYVKLDAAVGVGVAREPARGEFVAGLVRMLHAIGVQAICEGVVDGDDAAALLAAGVDGLTGPWIGSGIAV